MTQVYQKRLEGEEERVTVTVTAKSH